MKRLRNSQRQSRTRLLIQAGGLLHKSGLMDAFNIHVGEDLQDYESLQKAARLLGFLSHSFENQDFTDQNLADWERIGERHLRYK